MMTSREGTGRQLTVFLGAKLNIGASIYIYIDIDIDIHIDLCVDNGIGKDIVCI